MRSKNNCPFWNRFFRLKFLIDHGCRKYCKTSWSYLQETQIVLHATHFLKRFLFLILSKSDSRLSKKLISFASVKMRWKWWKMLFIMLKVLFVLKIFKKIRKLGSITKFMLTSGKQTITIHISPQYLKN